MSLTAGHTVVPTEVKRIWCEDNDILAEIINSQGLKANGIGTLIACILCVTAVGSIVLYSSLYLNALLHILQ